ncbi:hypothetical protein [Bradyrhizobium icense]|uniref:Uncharacterized protein n=1 Tax=Bradyrhizobium icense TaxID=1274631 RepID=A0A1B1UD75_9BRAD|nr:hypothetical protein [Bradyrhizobium icense]ANW00705.1 hypothetical protein LMTR13_11505 [Bradyrhizobium icense]
MKIEIEWLHDSYDNCETCGTSYAEGARVYVDGALAVDMSPVAHCLGGAHYSDSDVYSAILKHLGHEVLIRPEPASTQS